MNILSNIIYVLATTSLFIGSVLSFDHKYIPDYFYMIGTSLFLIKSLMAWYYSYKHKNDILYTSIQ